MPKGSLTPTTDTFQIAIDPDVDPAHRTRYIVGLGPRGKFGFSGGGLHDATELMRNGVLRLDHVPAYFFMELCFQESGCSAALVSRQCKSPEANLVYSIRNPDNLAEGGDWLWLAPEPR